MKYETPAEYDERQQRCREIAATLTLEQAGQIVLSTDYPNLVWGGSEHDQFVAANMRLRQL